jgi:hypothetical protein
MKMKIALSFLLLSLLYNICCYSNFTGIEICGLYKNYASQNGNYGEKGVSSPSNFPGARFSIQGVYNKTTNTMWIFGGFGYGETGGMKLGIV